MIRVFFGFVVLVTIGVSARADDESKVDLRSPTPKVGQVFRESSRSQMKDADFTIKTKGVTNKTKGVTTRAKMSMSSVQELEQKILAMDGGAVTKFQTRYIMDEKTIRIRKPGSAEEMNEEIGDLAGQVVISQKVKGKWTHTLKEGEPTLKQRLGLLDLTGWDDDESTPGGKRPIGTTWEVDATHLTKVVGPGVTGLSGMSKATFTRIEKYQGDRCAVIETAGRIKGKMTIEGKEATLESDLKVLTYSPINRPYTKTIIESSTRVTFKPDDDTIVEMKGKVTGEVKRELKD